MKTKLTILLTAFLFLPMLVKAQSSFYNDSSQTTVCDTSYYLSIAPISPDYNSWAYGNFVINSPNIINSNLSLNVEWGDGTNTVHTGTAVTAGTAIIWNTPLSHLYTISANYNIILAITDLTTNVTYTDTLNVAMGTCSQYIYSNADVDCDSDGVIDTNLAGTVPLLLQNASASYTGTTFTSFTQFSSVSAGTYQIVVDPIWLIANNYIVTSISPDTLVAGFSTNSPTIQINLACDTSNFVSNCLSGIVFCDANNNGILDSLETYGSNAPITLHLPDGTTHTTTADPNGLYSFNYSGNPSGGFVTVDQNWLNTNNYFASLMFSDTISDLSCAIGPTLNIPIICDTNALSVGCIDGYVYCDDNNNGIIDSNETVYYNAPVTLAGLGGLVTIYTDSTGYYSYTGWQLSGGNVFVSIDLAWQTLNNAYVPANGIFLTNLNCAVGNVTNIGLDCNNALPCADLWSSVTPWNGYYQNFNNSVWLKYGNYGTSSPGNYTVTLDFPSGLTPVTTSINNSNYTITGNTITWTLNSTSNSMYFSDVIYFSTPSGIPDSTFHIFSTNISSATSDCDSSNNYSTLGMLVGVSYDPNDKSVNKPLIVDPAVQDEYTYVVRFQNTGTAPAQDVYILDTLSANLDLSTFEIVEATHPMQLVDLGNGIVKFDFPQIWLPDSTTNEPASHGQVVYKIKELASLGEGDIIENTAYIFFDQNPAIITNTTKNINTVGLGITKVGLLEFNLYPNPANSEINIQTEGTIELIRIIDLSGKVVYNTTASSNLENINIDGLSSGLYNIEIKTSNGIGRSLFIKK